jgi:hypothetical protein
VSWDAIIEAKIAEAQRAGVFDDLPGAGKPLDLDDDRLVPGTRASYRPRSRSARRRRTCASWLP